MNNIKFILLTFFTTSFYCTYAQVNLVVNGSSNVTSINTGSQFIYTLNYSISSINSNGINVVATIPLPANVEPWSISPFSSSVSFSPSQISSVTYNPITNTVTITFVNPIPAGSSGQLDLRLKYLNGITPNGYSPNIITQISAANNANPNPTVSLPVNVNAIASNNFNVTKTRVAGGAINNTTIYQININSSNIGGLNLVNPVIYDTLPIGVDFIEAEPFSGSSAPVYNPITRVVSWNWSGSLNAGYSSSARISVKYTSPTYSVGSNVTNSATLAGDIPVLPLGNFAYSQKTGATSFLIQSPNNSAICNGAEITAATANWLNRHILAGTSCNTFHVGWSNNGNTELDSIKITYNIDKSINMNVIKINPVIDGFGRKVASKIRVEYATNINPFTIHTTLINDSGSHDFTISLPSGQYITQVRISVLSNIPIGATQNLNYCGNARTAEQGAKNGSPIIEGITYNTSSIGDDGTIVTNTSSGQFFKNNVATNFSNCSNTAEILDQIAVFNRPTKTRLNSNSDFNASDTVIYRIRVQIGGNLIANNVIFTDTLDSRLTYITGSSLYYTGTSNTVPISAVSITPTVTGNILVWNLGNLNPGNSYNIVFRALINPGTPAGTIGNRASVFSSNSLFPVPRTSLVTNITLNTNVALRVFKGQNGCNPDYVYFPDFAIAQEAGPVNYKITLKNLGNVSAKDIVLVDIFPFISDFRGSQWFANLVGPVLTSDINSTVFYTTTHNPCYSADFTGITNQPGCNTPVWTITPPLDITSVKAIKITRNIPLPVFDSIELIWQMRAPTGTPNGLKMNNSITFQCRRNDNNLILPPSTPNMVGMFTSCVPVLGSLGNYVWIDINKNGIQDESSSFGLNGVKVFLYNTGPDNLIGGGDDFIVDSTVSANDFSGNPGYYKFIEIPTGNYYVKFQNPFSDYKPSPLNNQHSQTDGNNDLDSLTGYSGVVFINASGSGVDKNNNTIDAGYYPIGNLGNYVWIDDNKDGINNEPSLNGINGVKVYLYRDFSGNLVLIDSTVTTDFNGNNLLPGYYNFVITESGNYRVGFPLNIGSRILTNQTTTPGVDNNSDANITNGLSPIITMNVLGSGILKNNPTIDAGYKCNLTNPTITGNNGFCTGGNTLLTGSSGFSYQWFRNNIIIPGAVNQTYLASLPGNYTLKITDESNCEATSTPFNVSVYHIPSANVSVPDPEQCVGSNIVTFYVNTFSDNTRYYYNFGNSVIDSNSATSMVYSYPAHGTFNYTVTAKDTITGCNSSFNGTVTIWPQPDANTNLVSPNIQCLDGNMFVIKNNSTIPSGTINSFYWVFGDGNDSLVTTNDSMVYSYTTPGNYSIFMTATSNNNCTSIDTIDVEVKPTATANFTFNDVTCDISRLANFTNTSSSATGYLWNFGDGNNSTAVNPTHTYSANGNYNVSLIAYTPLGCNDTIIKPLTIGPVISIDFDYQIQACSDEVNFNNLTVGAVSYVWDFDNGNTSTDFHPTNIYTTNGIYNVTLIATSSIGCKDTIVKPVNFNYVQPTALFSYNVLDCEGNIEFTNLSTNAVEYIWNFGNGLVCTHTVNNIIRNFGPGTYHVSLIAKGLNSSCADTFSVSIVVPPKPIAIFSSIPQLCSKTYNFKNISYFSTDYDWNFGDPASGGANTSNLFEPSHTFTANGTYIVRLIAKRGVDCRDTIYDTINVDDSGISPTASFNYTDISTSCLNVIKFNNTSSNAVNYVWLFHNDSSTTTVVNPTKTYPMAGTYAVTLFAISSTGCVDTMTLSVNIAHDKEGAYASFDVNDSVQCLKGNNFNFLNNSIYYGHSWIPKYYWDFGDGTFDTTNTFVFNKKYDSAGVYTVRLVAVSVSGCKDTAYQTVRVKPSAKPNFYAGTECTMTAKITNLSTDGIAYLWNYGDDNNLVLNNSTFHTHTYTTTGWHIIKLIALADNGCHDSATVPVFPFNGDKPTADFEWDTLECSGAIKFKSTSWAATEFKWFFGDGSPMFYGYDPVHPYAVAGLYNVMMIASNGPGCVDTVYKMVPAPAGVDAIIPEADFRYEVVSCLNIVSLINKSYQATGYQWFLNDSLIATTTNATIHNPPAGGHKLTLVAINGICTDTMHQYIVIQDKPIANFSYMSNNCSRSIVFNSHSINAVSYKWNFGDPLSSNNTAVGSTAAHTFTSNGTYFVKLVVENNAGCKDSIVKPVAVNGNINPIRASFNYNYNTCDCPNSNKIEFDNTSQGSGLRFLWNFGDGRTSTQRSPNKGYADTGWFTVTLTAYDSNGCAATATAQVYIPGTAHGASAGFTTDVTRQCITSNNFNFYNTSVYLGTGSWINKYYWYFGDGTLDSMNTSIFNKTYSTPGTYTVMLVAVAANGCRDTMTMDVVVEAVPCTGVIFSNNTSPHLGNFFGAKPISAISTGNNEIVKDPSIGMVLYPNPTSNNFTVEYGIAIKGNIVIKIYDMFGKEISYSFNAKTPVKSIPVNNLNLADGKYFVVLYQNGEFLGKQSVMIVK